MKKKLTVMRYYAILHLRSQPINEKIVAQATEILRYREEIKFQVQWTRRDANI